MIGEMTCADLNPRLHRQSPFPHKTPETNLGLYFQDEIT